MIKSFQNKATSDLFHGIQSAKTRKIPVQVRESALYKLDILNAANSLDDLRSPPGNRLEALQGDLSEYHSIRINIQWRLVFKWFEGHAYDVQIIDYH